MFTRASTLVCVHTLALLVSGCGSREAAESPVATAALTLNRDRVAIGSPLKLTYRFDVAADARIDGNYWVFVHVLEPDGELLWVEDHLPPMPTSTWKPGEKIEYSRTVFVPSYPYIGPAVVRLGLYDKSTNKRLVLSGEAASRHEYEVARFELQPQSENIFLIYKEGWHPAEVSATDPTVEWQWTKKSATVSFRNPKKDGTVYLDYSARVDKFSPPQQVTLRVGGEVIATFAAAAKDKSLITFPFTAAQLGGGEVAELTIEVDRTFAPGGSDTRELGIQLFHVFVAVQ